MNKPFCFLFHLSIAIREYKDALEIEPNMHRAKQGLKKAQQRQKLSETRDYYKILGVSKNASKRDIVKAYRKQAQKWHPDNFQEGEEKKRAQKKFIDIAAAKEVLTDDEKRAKFDQGEDPLDPESGRHKQGFNPFQEFHHFHGSPFQFKFHFN